MNTKATPEQKAARRQQLIDMMTSKLVAQTGAIEATAREAVENLIEKEAIISDEDLGKAIGQQAVKVFRTIVRATI